MPSVDPATLARAEAQLNADPRVQRLRQSQGRAQGGGAIDPREFGIDYLPPNYKYSLQGGRLVDQSDYADTLFPIIAGAGMGLGATGVIPGFGGLAGGATSQAPQLGNVNAAVDALSAGHAADAAAAASGLGNVNATADRLAGTTAAGTTALEKLRKSLTSSDGAAALASLIPLLAAANRGGGSDGGGGSDELARIQAITEARMRRADPLHQVAVQLAFQRAPIKARNGISLSNVALPE